VIARAAAAGLVGFTRLLVGARAHRHAPAPAGQSLYFANHASHLDTLAIWSALDPALRAATRPVAARDYWDSSDLKRHIAQKLLNVVLIDRHRENGGNPLDPVRDALRQGHSIIIFPEGTRGADVLPQPFKSGLFHLATEFPNVALAPVYLENLQRIMPKGAIWPVPLICKVHVGANDALGAGEDKPAFLTRMRDAIVALAPPQRPAG